MNDEPLPIEYCPLCSPEVDPTIEFVVPTPCKEHQSHWDGYTIQWSPDVGGIDNKQWCDLIHRGTSMVDPHD